MKKLPTHKTQFPPLAPVLIVILAVMASGCAATRPLKGGKAVTTPKPCGGVEQTLAQGENPSQATKQDQETIKVRTYTLPAGSRIEQSPPPASIPSPSRRSAAKAEIPEPSGATAALILSAPTQVVEREETRAKTELGAAQRDTAREIGAKLSSLKGIVWVGVGLFVFALASLVYPPLKLVIASTTTSAAITLGGIALMILPTLIVGNELLILGGVALAVGAWFLAHRHGHISGQLAASKKAK